MNEDDKALLAAERVERSTPPESPSPVRALGRVLVGYRSDVKLARGWRMVFAAIFLASGAAAFAVTGSVLGPTEAPRRSEDFRVLGRLDDYTRLVGQKTSNAIPGFLAMAGRVGVLDDTSSREAVTEIAGSELLKGFCSASVVTLIRQQFPGSYDNWSDADLEKTVLDKHPEYKDRLCVLPAWIDATPHNIIKFEAQAAAVPTSQPRRLLLTILTTLGFGLVLLNIYYRVIA